jgi:hypothetical protein
LIVFFDGREPYLFYSSFLYTEKKMGGQEIHRDTPRGGTLPALTVLLDLTGAVATTLVLSGSHDDFDCPHFNAEAIKNDQKKLREDPVTKKRRELVRATLTNNCFLVNAATAHCALDAPAEHVKLDLAFVAKWQSEEEHATYRDHCNDYSAHLVSYSVNGKFPLLPLTYLMQ